MQPFIHSGHFQVYAVVSLLNIAIFSLAWWYWPSETLRNDETQTSYNLFSRSSFAWAYTNNGQEVLSRGIVLVNLLVAVTPMVNFFMLGFQIVLLFFSGATTLLTMVKNNSVGMWLRQSAQPKRNHS